MGVARRVTDLDLSTISTTFKQVRADQWGFACVAVAVSFWAVGRYDGVLHGLLGTVISASAARYSGAVAIAISQFAGFGLVTGSLVRWRMLRGLSLWQASRITLAVSISFLAGWAVVTSVFTLLWGPDNPFIWWISSLVLAGLGVAIAYSLADIENYPKLPPIRGFGAITALVSVDLVFAGCAPYVLLPAEIALSLTSFLAVFLIAFGIGLICGTPGGVGPFELTLLALLPSLPSEPLLASILAFRLIYFLLPAALATAALIKGPLGQNQANTVQITHRQKTPYLSPDIEKMLWNAPRAECNILRQGKFGVLEQAGDPVALAANVGQSLVVLGDPIAASIDPSRVLATIRRAAYQRLRAPFVYKCMPRVALCARQNGWRVIDIVKEAWVDPQKFSCDGSSRRQLRRMIRKSHAAGIKVIEGGAKLPLHKMQDISDEWVRRQGGERGFSMGRFNPDYVQCQRTFLAYYDEQLVAYLTLHENNNEWAVDLMRNVDDTPDGTMHRLVSCAIESAKECRVSRFSLAAVPHLEATSGGLVGRLRHYVFTNSGAEGLHRFKTSFAPNWTTLYAAAPSHFSLALGIVEVLRNIRRDTGHDRVRGIAVTMPPNS